MTTTLADRLHLLYEVNRRLTTFDDLEELTRYSTQRTREIFDAEGCALLLLDSVRREFYFPVASQTASRLEAQVRLAEIRFPADRGIAGWVLANDQAVIVPDVTKDPRFYDGVDQTTQMTTRSILCAPLRTRSGNIGVIEVVNPGDNELSRDDLEFLEALANDIAVAHEKALLYQQLRGEVVGLRQACRLVGIGLLIVGVLLSLGAVAGHLARALPLRELPMRPGMWAGLGALAVGALLISVARGWLVPHHAAAKPPSA